MKKIVILVIFGILIMSSLGVATPSETSETQPIIDAVDCSAPVISEKGSFCVVDFA